MTAEGELETRSTERADAVGGSGRFFWARLRERLRRGRRPTAARPTDGRFGDLDPRMREVVDPGPDSAQSARRRRLLRAKVRRERRGLRSPLTRRILLLNVLVLVIPVLGLLHLDNYRQGLIAAELDGLRTQAQAFALSLGSAAVASGGAGREELVPEITRSLMRLLLVDVKVRARAFGRDGALIADSYLLQGPGGQVQVVELPPAQSGSLLAWLGRQYNRLAKRFPGDSNLPRYKERSQQQASDYEEVVKALAGNSDGEVRALRDGRLVLSVATPVQRYRQVLGALMLSKDGADIDKAIEKRRQDVLIVFAIALAVTVLLSFYLAGTIARPIRRLAAAAKLVRYGQGRRFEIPDFGTRRDEIGDLSRALRDMTQALWDRLDAIEGFAADVAHEIKNPLTSLRSAVETVTRVQDPEQQRRLMSIILDDVQRLDRLISDISDASRLDAELSRAQTEPVDIAALLETLVEIQSATLDPDRSPRFKIQLQDRSRLLVQGIEGRLGQVFRNLLSNAVTFSPPGGEILMSAQRINGSIVIGLSDEGPGLPEGKLEAIFDRFYSERPKEEKFGTHSGLGLSISKQIVDAHGGSIRAENRVSADGAVLGARFIVTLPAE